MRVAVTGGTGFIARGAIEAFRRTDIACRAISRSARPSWSDEGDEWITVPSYQDMPAMSAALTDVTCVIHLAANPDRRASHSAQESLLDTKSLIAAQRNSGARRVVFASSIYARNASGAASNSYSLAKSEVERQFLAARDIDAAILRLPPVYGRGGHGGLAALAGLVKRRVPLPLGMATAPRAYLSRRNLASLMIAMVTATDRQWQNASGQIFEPSDGLEINTRDLVRALATELSVTARLLPVPPGLLRLAAGLAGQGDFVAGAFDPLPVAPVKLLEQAFGWRPIEHVPDSLKFVAELS